MQRIIEKVLVPNFDELQAGRALDAMIAEKIMGWLPHCRNSAYYVKSVAVNSVGEQFATQIQANINDWRPSSDIAAAWQVIEKMQADGHCLEVRPYVKVSSGFRVGIWEGRELDYATGETAPLAICRAALKAFYLYTTAA